jgi:exopolyphosphatase/guanosine-5'-triphosphate,3'-diphosphate pyrophosphatase
LIKSDKKKGNMSEDLKKESVAVIDIGSSAIRMLIAEIDTKGSIRHLENLQKPIGFGRDVFASGTISTKTMRQAVEILKNYRVLMNDYGVKKYQAVATSAVRDALNRDSFIDQAFVRAGMDIELLEATEESRLELIAVETALAGKVALDQKRCLIVEAGSGSTEMIVLNAGGVEINRNFALGSMRLPEDTVLGSVDIQTLSRLIKRAVRRICAGEDRDCHFQDLGTFICLGGDMRKAAPLVGADLSNQTYAVLDKKEFTAYLKAISKKPAEEVAKENKMALDEAESYQSAILLYGAFLSETGAEEIIVPMMSIRDAILQEMAQMLSGYKRTDLSKQVLNSARHLGEKFGYDKAGAACVASLAIRMFDALQKDHGLGTRGRLLLEVAALLHGIGAYVAIAGYHKHSSYLIQASDLFGLRKSDKTIVSAVVRYHRKTAPKASHVDYMSLNRNDRAMVSKLAAILRVACALNESSQQLIKGLDIEAGDESYTIWVPADAGDLTLETEAVRRRGDLFLEVFGAPIFLKQKKT